jgi:hypothetical protein
MTDEKYLAVLASLNLTGEWKGVDFLLAPHPQPPAQTKTGRVEVTNLRPGVDLTAITIFKEDGTVDHVSKFAVISDLSAVGLTEDDLSDYELEMMDKTRGTTA